MIPAEDSHSGRVRASRTRVDESLEGSNPSSSALRASEVFLLGHPPLVFGFRFNLIPWLQKTEVDT